MAWQVVASRSEPLLKVSPPIPVGRLAGRFKLQLWRASSDFQLKLPLASQRGEVTVVGDACHLGIHQGDEVLSINDVAIQDLTHAAEVLEQSGQEVEIHFYHKESELLEDENLTYETVCCAPALCTYRTMPVWCDFFYNPPEPRCRAETWQLREVLATSKVIELPGNMWRLHLQRFSMKQSFALPLGLVSENDEPSEMSNLASEDGLLPSPKTKVTALQLCESFSSLPSEGSPLTDTIEKEHSEVTLEGSPKNLGTVVVLQALPLLGLQRGDELCRVNGHEINSLQSWKAATKHVMKIAMDFRRKTVPLEVSASPMKVLPDRRRSEDWHSVSSTKDCSRECSHNEEPPWSVMLYKSTCRPLGQNSVETLDAITSRTGTSQTKLSESQDVIFL